jgi:two-component system, NtrC family, nitrogen regulation response regulator NtrX
LSTTPSGTVLLLEDDASIRDLLALVLADDGHDVRPCGSTEEIVDLAATTPDALAVVDFWGTSHATLATDERDLLTDFAQTVPTVLVTGRGWASEEMAQEIGLAALVRKPFDVAEMSEVVRSCVAKVQADSEAPSRR